MTRRKGRAAKKKDRPRAGTRTNIKERARTSTKERARRNIKGRARTSIKERVMTSTKERARTSTRKARPMERGKRRGSTTPARRELREHRVRAKIKTKRRVRRACTTGSP